MQAIGIQYTQYVFLEIVLGNDDNLVVDGFVLFYSVTGTVG